MSPYSSYTFDTALVLKAAGLLAASADGTILDLGSGFCEGDVVIDLSACEIDTGNEIYTVSIEASNVAAMMSGSVCLGKKVFGNLVVPMDAALSASGRYVIPFRNEENGTLYRYVRLSTLVAGTIATGINFSAFIGMD
ncbi:MULTISPECIES: hypothetical protein [Methylobacter]